MVTTEEWISYTILDKTIRQIGVIHIIAYKFVHVNINIEVDKKNVSIKMIYITHAYCKTIDYTLHYIYVCNVITPNHGLRLHNDAIFNYWAYTNSTEC